MSARWTTLDVVMAGWLMARMPGAGLPADRIALYERILDREFVNWNAYLNQNVGRTADDTALRRAAAVVSLLSPPPETATAALKAAEITDLTSLAPGEIAALLRRFLTDADEGVLALRPDPLADHLLVTEFRPDALFDRCVDLVAGSAADDPDWAAVGRLVDNLTRAADRGRDVTSGLADRVLGRHPRLWPAALAAAWTRGGPFVASLEDLAGRDDTPLPRRAARRGRAPGPRLPAHGRPARGRTGNAPCAHRPPRRRLQTANGPRTEQSLCSASRGR